MTWACNIYMIWKDREKSKNAKKARTYVWMADGEDGPSNFPQHVWTSHLSRIKDLTPEYSNSGERWVCLFWIARSSLHPYQPFCLILPPFPLFFFFFSPPLQITQFTIACFLLLFLSLCLFSCTLFAVDFLGFYGPVAHGDKVRRELCHVHGFDMECQSLFLYATTLDWPVIYCEYSDAVMPSFAKANGRPAYFFFSSPIRLMTFQVSIPFPM